MKYVLLVLSVFIISACNKGVTPSTLVTTCGTGQIDSNGHICSQGGFWKPMLGGQCHTSADCPFPYNNCDKTLNVCTKTAASTPTLFATDAIQPGITINSSLTQDYVYNIMAKGYASLNDWCMSQAQQSTISTMRQVGSWKALILAPGDTSASITSTQGTSIQQFFSTTPLAFNNPAGAPFSSTTPSISDKNGTTIVTQATNPTWAAWTGLSYNFCPALEQTQVDCDWGITGCDTSCRAAYLGADAACIAGAAATGAAAVTACELGTLGECTLEAAQLFAAASAAYMAVCFPLAQALLTECLCLPQPDVCSQYLGSFSGGNRASSCVATTAALTLSPQFSNWTSHVSSDIVGVFSLMPSNCTTGSGFLLTADCGGGSYYNSNASSSKPVLCVSQ